MAVPAFRSNNARKALGVVRAQLKLEIVTDEKLMEDIAHYRAEVVSLMKMANPEEEGFSFDDCEVQMQQVQDAYEALKAELLLEGAELRILIPVMIDILDQNNRIRRMPRHMVRAMHYLSVLSMATNVKLPG